MTVQDYTTVTLVKGLFPSNNFGTAYDSLFSSLITRASRAIDGLFKRQPGSFAVADDTTRYFDGNNQRELWIGELAAVPTVVSVAESGQVDRADGTGGSYTAYAVSDYWCWPDNAIQNGMPFLRLDLDVQNGSKSIWYRFPRAVKVTGKFGFATTSNLPDEIRTATEIQVVRYFKRAQQAYADVGAITELGQLRYVKDLDPEVKNILNTSKFATSIL